MILINNQEWQLRFVPFNSSILRNENGEYSLGVTIPEYKSIYIANSLNKQLTKRVVAHELSHAEFVSRGLFVPIYIEEILADILADNIVDVGFLTNEVCKYSNKC